MSDTFCGSAGRVEISGGEIQTLKASRVNKKQPPQVQADVCKNMLNTRLHTHSLKCTLSHAWGGSRNNIILPFTVARVIDEDEERLSRGSLHQPLLIPAARMK